MAVLLKRSLFSIAFLLTLVLVATEWITAPRHILENEDYTGLEYIAKIRSDKENFTTIWYYLSGPGVDRDPKNIFGINRDTGFLKVYSILDREKIAFYQLKGIAKFTNNTLAEKIIDLNITIDDVNDCAPVIKTQQVGSVNESSAAGTLVMKVIATDADLSTMAYSKIYYSIASQTGSAGMFYINSHTGEVFVQRNTLDRETQDTYKLIIKAADNGGQPGGNTGIGEIEIKLLDINDNIPTLERDSYEGRVEENTVDVEVLRIQAVDLDLINTDNWLAVFKFVSGNEQGFFSITTDSKTNEGIIMIRKALDYEELKTVNLKVAVSNKAEYNFGHGRVPENTITEKHYPITINVVNQKEGPRFHPSVKVVTMSEDHTTINLNKIITNYAAIDTDTSQTVTNVRYAKLYDVDNWLLVDENTADIRLNKMPDRESKFLINGTYYSKIICITKDIPSKTATGTIAIQVEDFNDHCPKLTSTTQTMCNWENFIYATAIDHDEFPNSGPFDFTVIHKSSNGKWNVEPLNETTVILRDEASLWPGAYKVVVQIKDQQGKSCDDVQTIDVVVCTCGENTKACLPRSGASKSFGPSGVLLLLLGLLLLLLVPLLLLFCLCGGAAAMGNMKPIPYDTKQQLISYHTEGQGEDKAVPLINAPTEVDHGTIGIKDVSGYEGKWPLGGLTGLGGAGGGGAGGMNISTLISEDIHDNFLHGQGHFHHKNQFGAFDGMALPYEFLGNYYRHKSSRGGQQTQEKDTMLVYDNEGRESPAGSVGCCSLLENDDDLSFLNDLGPKFKTLAEICKGSALVTETVDARVSFPPPPRPVSPVRPSTSSHTHVHTHSETVRDRDHAINTLNTSNIGSSTLVQEERLTERTHIGSVPIVQDKIVIPSQTVLVQQPTMYYTAQPMYVVDPKPQVVLVAGGTQQAVGQVGLGQGLVQVSGVQAPQGVILVESQAGGATKKASHGTISGSRHMFVESGSSGGEQVAQVSQSFVRMHGGSAGQAMEASSQARQMKSSGILMGSHGFISSNEGATPIVTPKLQGSQRVVTQHKKVSVTEKNIE